MRAPVVGFFAVAVLVGSTIGCGNDPVSIPVTDGAADMGASNLDAGMSSSDGASADAESESDSGLPDATADPGADSGADLGADSGNGPTACTDPFTSILNPAPDPPFSGTAYVTNDLLTESDPSSFVDLAYVGQATRRMYDRRVAAFIDLDAHIYEAQFGTSKMVDILVNPEFTQAEAEVEARTYAEVIGRIPAFFFRDIDEVWIHDGLEAFGGGNRSLLIHVEQGEQYAAGGSLEEIFIHEAAHTSLDSYHASAPRWLEAQQADGVAISTYARDNPNREDVAESVGPYLAYRFGGTRVETAIKDQIEAAIPNRIQYFDCLELSMDPLD